MVLKSKHLMVKEVMERNVFTVYPDETAFHASVLMASHHIGSLPVIKEDGTLLGIITDRDILTRCNAVGKDVRKTKIFECMTANPVRTVPSTSIGHATLIMGEYGIRRLPIVEHDKLVGLISIADIAEVSDGCPNKKCPDETCILVDMAKELQKSSHSYQSCDSCHL